MVISCRGGIENCHVSRFKIPIWICSFRFKDSEIWDHKGFGFYNVQSDRFSPFTYGPRNCLGKNFSHMEMRLILLNIFKNYDFSLDSEQQKTINDSKYMGINTFTMGPLDVHGGFIGMYMNIHNRKSKL